jgi:hypothetical protein
MADPAGDEKITIEWGDLNTRKVDQRLREQEALARNRQQADRVPVASDHEKQRRGLFSHPAVVMALFGLLGGLLAWGARESFRLRTDLRAEADIHREELRKLDDKDTAVDKALAKDRDELEKVAKLNPDDADKFKQEAANIESKAATAKTETQAARDELLREYGDNPYFKTYADTKLTPAEKATAIADLDKQEAPRKFISSLASFGLTGMFIAICLAVAEPLTAGNKPAAVLNGLLGAVLGLIGGAAASFFFDKIYQMMTAGQSAAGGLDSHQIIARSVSWGVLGLFLAVGPAVAFRNAKKLVIGIIGGSIGGLVGGAVYEPVFVSTGGIEWVSWLIALALIGLTAGLATGLIENAAKNGWVKVTAGLIAGKQFILYRNPTFIGSGPECPIYLFRDPKVGKRHAAIHVVPGGFELENLPLGDVTLVNDKPVSRTKLKTGDVIGVGGTRFEFHEKKREKKAIA